MGKRRNAVLLAGAMLATPAWAGPPKPLFASDAPIHITLRAPGAAFQQHGGKNPLPGTLTVEGPTPEALPITLTQRGITRRSSDICQFPPLRVDFTAKPAEGSLFQGQKHLKLVTHCQASSDFQHYTLIEYAAYKMYNLLTPQSIDARLAEVTYQDQNGKNIITRTGFFLEDVGDTAKRNDLAETKPPTRIASVALEPAAAARVAIFEYMIGNLDWAIIAGPPGTSCCHNSKLIAATKESTQNYVPLPYDYDFSGLVDAPYATPPQAIKVPNVRTRRYRGYCRLNAQAQAAAADAFAHRDAILATLDQVPGLAATPRKKAQAYLADFFKLVDNPDDVQKHLLSECQP